MVTIYKTEIQHSTRSTVVVQQCQAYWIRKTERTQFSKPDCIRVDALCHDKEAQMRLAPLQFAYVCSLRLGFSAPTILFSVSRKNEKILRFCRGKTGKKIGPKKQRYQNGWCATAGREVPGASLFSRKFSSALCRYSELCKDRLQLILKKL